MHIYAQAIPDALGEAPWQIPTRMSVVSSHFTISGELFLNTIVTHAYSEHIGLVARTLSNAASYGSAIGETERQRLPDETVWGEWASADSIPAEIFERLAGEWEQDRPRGVDIVQMIAHPAYRSIIAMGPTAVPWLLDRLQENPNHWFVALRTITGVNPVPPESRGRFKEMTAAWLEWGRREGFVAADVD